MATASAQQHVLEFETAQILCDGRLGVPAPTEPLPEVRKQDGGVRGLCFEQSQRLKHKRASNLPM
ncbi:MAG: hypothetical protein ABIW79_05750 [Gemmatimonas sp.]